MTWRTQAGLIDHHVKQIEVWLEPLIDSNDDQRDHGHCKFANMLWPNVTSSFVLTSWVSANIFLTIRSIRIISPAGRYSKPGQNATRRCTVCTELYGPSQRFLSTRLPDTCACLTASIPSYPQIGPHCHPPFRNVGFGLVLWQNKLLPSRWNSQIRQWRRDGSRADRWQKLCDVDMVWVSGIVPDSYPCNAECYAAAFYIKENIIRFAYCTWQLKSVLLLLRLNQSYIFSHSSTLNLVLKRRVLQLNPFLDLDWVSTSGWEYWMLGRYTGKHLGPKSTPDDET